MSDDWKFYSGEPEYKTARVAENEYHSFRRHLMFNGCSAQQQGILEQKKQALLSSKAAVADLVGVNPCMKQFLDRHPKFIPNL